MKVKVRKKNIEHVEKSEQVTETNKKLLVKWLEENKIIFETLLAVTLSVASLVVSVMSVWQEWIKADNETKLNMPIFSIKQEFVVEEPEIDEDYRLPDYFIEYKIVNQGGELSSGKADFFQMLEVRCHPENSEMKTIKYKIYGAILDSKVYYDPDDQTFTVRKTLENDWYRIGESIEESLKNEYPDCEFYLFIYDYAKVTYKDYRNKEHEEYYDLDERCQIDDPAPISITEGSYTHLSRFYSLTEDELYGIIKADVEEEIS